MEKFRRITSIFQLTDSPGEKDLFLLQRRPGITMDDVYEVLNQDQAIPHTRQWNAEHPWLSPLGWFMVTGKRSMAKLCYPLNPEQVKWVKTRLRKQKVKPTVEEPQPPNAFDIAERSR